MLDGAKTVISLMLNYYTDQEQGFTAKKGMLEMNREDWDALTEDTFKQVFSGSSSLKRTQFSGLKRNMEFLK